VSAAPKSVRPAPKSSPRKRRTSPSSSSSRSGGPLASAILPRATRQRATLPNPPAPRPDPPPRRARRRPLVFFVFAALLIGTMVLGLTALNAVLAQGSFRIDDLSRRVDALQQEHDRKQLEIARLSAPGRIAREAAHLGMALPDPSQVKVIHLGREHAYGRQRTAEPSE